MRLCSNRHCQHEAPAAARFCPRCGSRVRVKNGPLMTFGLVVFMGLALLTFMSMFVLAGVHTAAPTAVQAATRIPPRQTTPLSSSPFPRGR